MFKSSSLHKQIKALGQNVTSCSYINQSWQYLDKKLLFAVQVRQAFNTATKKKDKQTKVNQKNKEFAQEVLPKRCGFKWKFNLPYETIFRVLYTVKFLIQPLLKVAKAPVVDRAFLQKWIVLRFIYILIL